MASKGKKAGMERRGLRLVKSSCLLVSALLGVAILQVLSRYVASGASGNLGMNTGRLLLKTRWSGWLEERGEQGNLWKKDPY